MSDSVDIFSDLLSGLKPASNADATEERDSQPVKLPSMHEVRSAKHKEHTDDKVDVRRSNSPIGVGLAPPPPPLSRDEMTELFSEVLKAHLLEAMKSLTSKLHTCLQSMDDRIGMLDEKMDKFDATLAELQQAQSASKSTTEKALSDMSQSVRETGMGMQRVIDKQELVDARLLLSKLQLETESVKEEARNSITAEHVSKTAAKSKDTGDSGCPSEPNPPSPIPTGNMPQMKQHSQSENVTKPATNPALQTPPTASGPESQVAWQPTANTEPSTGNVVPPQAPMPPPSVPTVQPVPREPQEPRQMYNPGQDTRKELPPQYETLGQPPPQQMIQPTAMAQQQPPQTSYPPPPPAYSQQPGLPTQRSTIPPPQQPPPRMSIPPPQPPPQAPPQGPQPHMQWQPSPPQPPAHQVPPTPQLAPSPSPQYGQMPPQPPQQMPPYPTPGNMQPPPPGAYPNIAQMAPPPPGHNAPMPPQAPPPAPIYGAPPSIMSSQGSRLQSGGGGARTGPQTLPLDQVIDDVTAMGFERTRVRSVVTDMIDQGKSVDLNLVIDRLMNRAGF